MKRALQYLLFLIFLFVPLMGSAQGPRERWEHLNPREKERVWRNYDRWQKLPPENKERLRREWDHWRSLPPDRQEEIKKRYEDSRQHPSQERGTQPNRPGDPRSSYPRDGDRGRRR